MTETEGSLGWAQETEGYGRAREAAERSLALEPNLAEGHVLIAAIRRNCDWDWRGAEASLARALDLAPGNALVLRGAAMLAHARGQLEEDIRLSHRAVEQDPLSATAYHNLGLALQGASRWAESEAAHRRALELSPLRATVHANLALSLLAQGRGAEALAEAMRETDELFGLNVQAIVHHAIGHGAESEAALRELIEKYAEDGAYQIAEVHGTRGEADAAFEWLERAYTQRDGGLIGLRCSSPLRSLHGDPRWSAFLKKMGLED